MGKIIVIEGTDCSGKETQAKMLMKRLMSESFKVDTLGFPVYTSPTGKIVGGPYLGKEYICKGWFPEGAPNVEMKVASLYYAADRRYHLKDILEMKDNNDLLILDRYTTSNLAHQGGKIFDREKRLEAYKFIEDLEFNMLNLPRPDKVFLLHMPYEYACIIKKDREEALDENERDEKHLKNAELAYLELAKLYNYKKIECVRDGRIKTREEVHEEIYEHTKKLILK